MEVKPLTGQMNSPIKCIDFTMLYDCDRDIYLSIYKEWTSISFYENLIEHVINRLRNIHLVRWQNFLLVPSRPVLQIKGYQFYLLLQSLFPNNDSEAKKIHSSDFFLGVFLQVGKNKKWTKSSKKKIISFKCWNLEQPYNSG